MIRGRTESFELFYNSELTTDEFYYKDLNSRRLLFRDNKVFIIKYSILLGAIGTQKYDSKFHLELTIFWGEFKNTPENSQMRNA